MAQPARKPSVKPPSLFWQLMLPNAAVLLVAALILMLSPATVSQPVALGEAFVLVAGLLLMLAINLVIIRRAVVPLEQLAQRMARMDPTRPGTRARQDGGSAETAELAGVFNEMASRLENERRQSSTSMLLAQEGERLRLAQELHDEIGQSITGLMLDVDRVAREASEPTQSQLAAVRESARELSEQVRDVVRALRPDVLDDLGLTSALAALSARIAEQSGIEVQRSLGHTLPPIAPEVELAIYRIAQEALTNVARHSGARTALVELDRIGSRLRLAVSDDGCGLNGAQPGFGIQGMRERALLVGGSLTFSSPPSGGLSVELVVPSGEPAR